MRATAILSDYDDLPMTIRLTAKVSDWKLIKEGLNDSNYPSNIFSSQIRDFLRTYFDDLSSKLEIDQAYGQAKKVDDS